MIVLGGGYIAGEFAQILNTFGARVTMLERDPQLLGREDPDIASAVAEIFAGEGIDVRTGVAVSRVTGMPTARSPPSSPTTPRSPPTSCWSPSAESRSPPTWSWTPPACGWTSRASSR
jgi:hypothetical protein